MSGYIDIASVFHGVCEMQPAVGKVANEPFVNLITDGWRVSRSADVGQGYVDYARKIIHVPLDGSKMSERTRFHELGHLKWTPFVTEARKRKWVEEENIPWSFINAVEDARINRRLGAVGQEFEDLNQEGAGKIRKMKLHENLVERGVLPHDPSVVSMAVACYVSSKGMGENEDFREAIENAGIPVPFDEIDELVARVESPGATFDATLKVARELRDLLAGGKDPGGNKEGDGLSQQSPKGQPSQSSSQGQSNPTGQPAPPAQKPQINEVVRQTIDTVEEQFGYVSPGIWEKKPESYDIIDPPKEQKAASGSKGNHGQKATSVNPSMPGLGDLPDDVWDGSAHSTSHAHPGVLKLHRVPLTERITKKMHRPFVKKQDYEGGEIRQIHRLNIDQKVMRRRAPLNTRHRVGTLLIDVSGSMSISMAQIDHVLERAPQVTVALYSANEAIDGKEWSKYPNPLNGSDYWTSGHIVIAAHKGKRADSKELGRFLGGNNVVDNEALRWLANQPKPRYWICDGGVTGMEHEYSLELWKDCVITCKRAGIKRIGSMQKFMKLLENTA
jgi:hypothetical protein